MALLLVQVREWLLPLLLLLPLLRLRLLLLLRLLPLSSLLRLLEALPWYHTRPFRVAVYYQGYPKPDPLGD